MRVKTAQLIPNCILTNDIIGKSGRPLIPKNTILSDHHILFLHKFLIKDVDVSSKLADGSVFKPAEVDESEEEDNRQQNPVTIDQPKTESLSFKEHYLLVVQAFKDEFMNWEYRQSINMLTIRNMFMPLLDRIEKVGLNLFFLHHHFSKKDYIFHHSVSIALLSSYVAKQMGLLRKEAIQVGLAGLLSDSGLAKINPMLIQKNIPMLEIKNKELKSHPTYSYRLIESDTTISPELKLAVLQHHERLDGSGFPLGLKSDKIHLYSRIIGVCDEYYAISSRQRFIKQTSPFDVIKDLTDSQFTKFDPKVIQTVTQTLTRLAIGVKVKLSNSQVGKIIFIDDKNSLHPMVHLEETDNIISLENEREIYITELLIDW